MVGRVVVGGDKSWVLVELLGWFGERSWIIEQ